MAIRINQVGSNKPFKIKFPYTTRNRSVWWYKITVYGTHINTDLKGLSSRFPHKWSSKQLRGSYEDSLWIGHELRREAKRVIEELYEHINQNNKRK